MIKTVRFTAILFLAALTLPLVFSATAPDQAAASIDGPHGNIYVDASRPNDLGDGLSWATAMKTIGAGIDIVDTDGTVHVAAGTYSESIYLDHSFTLSGASALTTFIDGGGARQVVRVSSIPGQVNTISGFTIQNGSVGGAPAEAGMLGGGMPVGGGVYVALYHSVTMNDCVIRNNTASFMGGGVYSAGHIHLNRCTISGNSAGMVGGGIANYSDNYTVGFMTLTNCTISGNRVTGTSIFSAAQLGDAGGGSEQLGTADFWLGGGVFNGGDAEFWNVTVANNSVPSIQNSHGGGVANVPLQCTNPHTAMLGGQNIKNRAMYKNTIVANNVPDNGYKDVEAVVLSLGNNIDSQNTCGFNQQSDQVNTDPLLGPLQNNGGPTPTMSICTNSPAFNRGDSSTNLNLLANAGEIPDPPILDPLIPVTDQRGVARPQAGIYDIGAYELVPPAVTTLDASDVGFKTATFNGNLTAGASAFSPVYVSFQYGSESGLYTGETAPQIVTSTGPFAAAATLPFGTCYFRARAVGGCAVYGDENSVAILPPQNVSGSGNGSTGSTGSSTVGLPGITVTSASLSATSTTPGTPVTVTASLANRGTVNGTTAVKVYVNGQEETSRGITVNSGSNVPITFTISRNEPGTYTVYVGGTSAGSFTVDGTTDPNVILWISISLIVAALIAFAFYLRRRQQVV